MKKPKVIPEGFEWDQKAKELIDTRCNNPKLEKLVKESVRVDNIPAIRIISILHYHDTGSLMRTIKMPKKTRKKRGCQ